MKRKRRETNQRAYKFNTITHMQPNEAIRICSREKYTLTIVVSAPAPNPIVAARI